LTESKRSIIPRRKIYRDVYGEDPSGGGHNIEGVATAITAFVGNTLRGPSNIPWAVNSYSEFEKNFSGTDDESPLTNTVDDFFANGGYQALIVRISKNDGSQEELPPDEKSYQAAFDALKQVESFNLLCLPPYNATTDVDVEILRSALKLCLDCRAILIIDPRSNWLVAADVLSENKGLANLGLAGHSTRNAAVFFPSVKRGRLTCRRKETISVPCGAVAGVIARTDAQYGVWKAPAGVEATIKNINGLNLSLTDHENNKLNSSGVNCLRSFSRIGPVIWGGRTLRGNDKHSDEYKYLSVRRLALFIEQSLFKGTQWAVFEPNSEPLWAQIRLNIGVFMHNLFRNGAFQGSTPSDAYFVKCDDETTVQNDINLGVMTILIGFAPLKPAEFVVIKIQHLVGQIEM